MTSYAQIDRDDERLTDLLVTKIPSIHDIVDLGHWSKGIRTPIL